MFGEAVVWTRSLDYDIDYRMLQLLCSVQQPSAVFGEAAVWTWSLDYDIDHRMLQLLCSVQLYPLLSPP